MKNNKIFLAIKLSALLFVLAIVTILPANTFAQQNINDISDEELDAYLSDVNYDYATGAENTSGNSMGEFYYGSDYVNTFGDPTSSGGSPAANQPTGSGGSPATNQPTGSGGSPAVNQPTGSGGSPAGTSGNIGLKNPLKVKTIGGLIQSAVEIFSYLVIIFAVLAFIWVGLQYILARGNAEKIKELSKWLGYIAIGVAVVIGARLIISIVINTLESSGTVDPKVIQSAKDGLEGR